MMMIVLRLLSLLGLKSRLRPPNKPFFRGRGWGVAGFVDSGPKTLMPSASNRSTPPVDSRGLQWTPAKGDLTRRDVALEGGHHFPGEQLERALGLLERQVAERHAAEA